MLAWHLSGNVSALEELVRLIVLSAGAFLLGFICYVAWAYASGRLHPISPYRVRSHVVSMILSYLLLLAALLVEIGHRAVDRVPITWRLPLGAVAFALGTYALVQLMRSRR